MYTWHDVDDEVLLALYWMLHQKHSEVFVSILELAIVVQYFAKYMSMQITFNRFNIVLFAKTHLFCLLILFND